MASNTLTLPADTSNSAAQAQIETLRQMGLSGRAAMTFQLCDTIRQTTKAGIRHRHPDYTDQQVTQAYLRLILDKKLYEKVFPGGEISA